MVKELNKAATKKAEAPTKQVAPNYVWSPEDLFQMNGRTLEASMTILASILSQPESQKVLALNELYKMYQGVFEQGIKDGTIVDKNAVSDQNVETEG